MAPQRRRSAAIRSTLVASQLPQARCHRPPDPGRRNRRVSGKSWRAAEDSDKSVLKTDFRLIESVDAA